MQIDRRSTQSCGHSRRREARRWSSARRPRATYEPASNGALHVARERENRDGDRANCTLFRRDREVRAASTDRVGTANVPEFVRDTRSRRPALPAIT